MNIPRIVPKWSPQVSRFYTQLSMAAWIIVAVAKAGAVLGQGSAAEQPMHRARVASA
jgi:hypothetical protein